MQRFALQTHDSFDPAQAMRFALEHQNPLVTARVTGGNGYPESSFSFIRITNPDVLLWALKPAEEGIERGIIARVWNLSQKSAGYTLASPLGPFSNARHVTHIESPIGNIALDGGAITDLCKKQQMKTLLFKMANQ
jgi:alpha-mannosidase